MCSIDFVHGILPVPEYFLQVFLVTLRVAKITLMPPNRPIDEVDFLQMTTHQYKLLSLRFVQDVLLNGFQRRLLVDEPFHKLSVCQVYLLLLLLSLDVPIR